MRRTLVIVSLIAGAAALSGTAWPRGGDSSRHAEVARLQSHFDSVDTELRARDVAHLAPSARARRAHLTQWLADYRNAARFPTNDSFDEATPFFRGSDGTFCAMAYLIDRSGRRDIVNRIEATRNNAYIAELADDPALVAWLDSAGLSVAEAARIQPAYGGDPGPGYPGISSDVGSDYALGAIALSSVSLAASAVNVVKPGRLSGFLGILAGGASIGVGASYRGMNRATDRVAAATIGLGVVSLGAGVYGLLESRRDVGDLDDRRRGRGRGRVSTAVSPDFALQDADPRLGVRIVGRF